MSAGLSIGWGFWGAGEVASAVAEDLRRVSGATLKAVGSRTAARATAFAARHGVGRSVTSLEALLDDPGITAVYIATPHPQHAQDCLRAIDAGKAVLCEKPFTMTADEAEQVVAAARRRGVFVMEAMWMRFIPAVVEARRLVQSGALGPIRFLQADFGYPAAFDPRSRLFDPGQGGGALLDRGIYPLSLACFLLGFPDDAQAVAQLGPSGVDEQVSLTLRYGSGTLAHLASSLSAQLTNEAHVVGERGRLSLRAPFYRAHRYRFQALTPPQPVPSGTSGAAPAGLKGRLKSSPTVQLLKRRADGVLAAAQALRGSAMPFPGHGYQFELAEVGRCLSQGLTESPTMPLDESVRLMRLMDQLRSTWTPPASCR